MGVDSLFSLEAEPEDEERLQGLYDRLSARFGFGPAEVRLSSRKLTGGEIRYGRPHRITISRHLSPAERHDTLLHEAAHAWVHARSGPRQAHGPLFRRLARQLGASDRHAPLTEALRRFRREREIRYRCEGCGRVFARVRPFRGARYCLACYRAGKPARLRRI